MKNCIANTGDKAYVLVLLILIAISFVAIISTSPSIITYSLIFFVPLFSAVYFSKNKTLRFSFIAYLLFSFLGDASCLFFRGSMLTSSSSIFYFLGFVYLLMMILPKFKLSVINTLVRSYLIGVFSIIAFFLFKVYGLLSISLESSAEVQLFAVKSLSLIVLSVVAFGIYLSNQTKASVMFLFGVIGLLFSVVLNYVNLYYLYHSSFVIIERLLYAVALFFLFKYIVIDKEQVQYEKSNFETRNVLV